MPSSFADISRAISNTTADPFSPPPVYFSKETDAKRNRARTRTTSTLSFPRRASFLRGVVPPSRRTSHDEISLQNEHRKFLIPVNKTLKELLENEGNKDQQITIDDHGPKTIFLGTLESNGFRKVDVRGNYVVSNLLQELWLAKMYGMTQVTLDEVRLTEDPVHRLSRIIRDTFWTNLTRKIDASSIRKVATDTKDWTANPRPRIYIPHGQQQQYDYYTRIAKELKAEDEEKEATMTQKQKQDENFKVFDLEVVWLPEHEITGEFIRDLNEKPGLLAIAMEEWDDPKTGERTLRGLPFVVPGGRFNELYGWDSYMIALGLIINGKVDLAMSMVKHFCFCIKYYGKIFNANRSYYLGRSQPPFLTDMALAVYEEIKEQGQVALDFLKEATLAAIKEYHGIWMSAPRIDPKTGLSRYRPVGVGVPPETEASHFVHYLQPYADKHKLSFEAFVQEYNYGRIKEPELDEYFLHDRAVRESGHDTSYRLEKVAANLATIDLNSLLYKYETDIAMIIRKYFKNSLAIPAEFTVAGEGRKPGYIETSAYWDRAAKKRRAAVEQYMWDDEAGMYFDYDTVKEERHKYETATTFWSMWAGLATPARATALVEKALPKFEEFGGLASGTEKSRGEVGLDRPNRQWDYPYGWAPQQMLAWRGLHNYGYRDDAARLAYKWLYMVTKAFHDFNGVVVEKYNVTEKQRPHAVLAEYGNQGADFKGVATEGFGWVNASYVCGMSLMNVYMQRALGSLVPWDKSPFH